MARVILRLSWRGLCPGWAPYEVKQPDAPPSTGVRPRAALSTSSARSDLWVRARREPERPEYNLIPYNLITLFCPQRPAGAGPAQAGASRVKPYNLI